MARKPSNLLYGVDEKPPLWISLVLGLQHVCIIAIAFIFPVMVIQEAGGTQSEANRLVSMSMLAGGIGVLVQAMKRGPVGSGYFCPQVCGPSFLTASILALKTGGLSLLFGMTLIAGLFEAFLSRALRYLRSLFPAEVTGLIVAMVGLTVTRLAFDRFLSFGEEDPTRRGVQIAVATASLAIMIGLNVWSKGHLKIFCILIGMGSGYLLTAFTGGFGSESLEPFHQAPLLAYPLSGHPGWSFNLALVPPFLIAMICSSLKTVGDLTTCQKINDAEWKRPDMDNVSGGILADSVGCVSAGLLGGLGQSSSSTNIGLSIATGATSRALAWATGAILIFLAFCPKVASVFTIMPAPVMGATLVFAVSFMIVAGFQIIMSRMMDSRKTFVVGLSILFGLSVDIIGEAYAGVPHFLQPIFSSSLSAATVMAILLNLIFRLGVAKRSALTIDPERFESDRIYDFMQERGGAWGAQEAVISRMTVGLNEAFEAILAKNLSDGPIQLEVRFDEFNLDGTIHYSGPALELPTQRPDLEAMIDDPDAGARMSGYLTRHYADQVKTDREGDQTVIRLHWDH